MAGYKIIVALLIGALCLASTVSGKKKCQPPKEFAPDLDYDWVMGRTKWYFPFFSKLDLVRVSSDILKQKMDTIPEEERSKACIKAKWNGLTPVVFGYGGKKTSYSLSPLDFTNFNILGFEKAWEQGQAGTLYITHSDNKNFVVFMRCWEDGERSWSVMTTKKKPSDEVKAKIVEHVKGLGFAEDDMEVIDYTGCNPPKKSEL